ncbi:hypothetical protein K435DRAFT_836354 [Dendrothele bispora CBS 962.96]|uniref:Uncharacterized protein n=1 Tax=Dendrothele bispora (strain CBS 962.96) TaxID=1314807 RepID=A0A4S8MID2_DENBC|nr:hypothetical protein K435DRAFT_836354 [Dendrothele bispora CBS 962.96]
MFKYRKGDWQLRKKSLEGDSWAIEVDPRAVTCRGCHRRIKLSEKSTYDTYHWGVHKKRCKIINPKTPIKPKASARNIKSKTKPKPKTRAKSIRKVRSPTPAPVVDHSMSSTPSLTEDESGDEDMTSPEQSPLKRASSELSPPPSSEPPSDPQVTYGKWSEELDDYFTRMHGIKQMLPVDMLGMNWQDWSWAQLHEAEFPDSPPLVSTPSPS